MCGSLPSPHAHLLALWVARHLEVRRGYSRVVQARWVVVPLV